MEIRPILSSLRKHRIPAVLIVLEIAMACAILCNAVFMIGQRVRDIHVPNAIDQSSLSIIAVRGNDASQAADYIPRNLAALRGIPGVESVTVMNTVPLNRNSWNTSLATGIPRRSGEASNSDLIESNVAEYLYTAGGGKTLGLKVLQGRLFNADESAGSKLDAFMPSGHVILITKSLAERYWPGENAVGKVLYMGDRFSYTVVGVVADVLRPEQDYNSNASFYGSVFFPLRPNDGSLNQYVLRSTPEARRRVLREGVAKLSALGPWTVVEGKTFSDIRDDYFADARSMVWMLVLVCVVMLAVTAFGIVGLASFWVRQRRRQIGIRRAVGASRGDILRYFQTENFLLTLAGVAIGMILAYGLNLYLMKHYELTRLPWYFLPGGAISLWLLGQLAVLGPALRAARVPPVVATRSA